VRSGRAQSQKTLSFPIAVLVALGRVDTCVDMTECTLGPFCISMLSRVASTRDLKKRFNTRLGTLEQATDAGERDLLRLRSAP